SGFSGAIISSVVPEVVYAVKTAIETVTGITPLVLSSDIGTGLKIVKNAVGQLGADLAVASVAARDKYPLPCFIVDLGTATKIILIDEDGTFLGCTISAGVGISLEALAQKTSQLPTVSLTAPSTSIGTNTVDCMKSGTVFGTAAMLDGLTARMERDFGKEVKTTVATGGLAEEIVKNCERRIVFDRDLILEGLKNIFNRKEK
ncbi:MAG: type III pantothenate kinase, partial [Oscillospiraceae bacterium]|nr:type III pantothenate kinase [Oscillospiraceae bacterium]